MIINSIREFIAACPHLSGGRLNTNFLGGKSKQYSIDNVSAEPVVRKYTDGSSLRQFVFNLSMRESYGIDEAENMRASELCEKVADWIEEQNYAGNFPELKSGIPTQLEVMSSGYLAGSDSDTARYQIRIRLLYKPQA